MVLPPGWVGCCVTDEQPPCSAVPPQRVSLTGRGQMVPHVLVMSATPIPRTLAMILYGDLDLSDIREMPKGRLAIKTYTATQADRPRIDGMIRRQLEEGGKVYIVCPVIEDSEELPLASAQAVHERLSQEIFPDWKVALMHGRLKAGEKAAVMEAFHAGEIHILVSTTVIEVGIDHPDASLLVVENAERFGLSQLHQLRGCVGPVIPPVTASWSRQSGSCSVSVSGFSCGRGLVSMWRTRICGFAALAISSGLPSTDCLTSR